MPQFRRFSRPDGRILWVNVDQVIGVSPSANADGEALIYAGSADKYFVVNGTAKDVVIYLESPEV